MLDADHPITNSSQDRLNRTPFAKALARSMLDHPRHESIVIGLYGGYGVGKTSLIHLTLEELNFASSNLLDEEKPLVINFSAWSYSGEKSLVTCFFRRLIFALKKAENVKQKEKLIELLTAYAAFFSPGILAEHNKEMTQMDLPAIKAEINYLLQLETRHLIIIIDNIARLTSQETQKIFQIIKSMANYANSTYLVALDKDKLVKEINDTNDNGEAWLEKMIQLPFYVPPILKQDLEAILADRLHSVLTEIPNMSWDNNDWADLYHGAIKFFFHQCRDITRYVNILQFSYKRVRDTVNPCDYFALTAIEVFMPEIYQGILDNKDLFTDLLDHVYELTDVEREEEKKRCDEIIIRSNKLPKEMILFLLTKLFPRLHKIYQPNIPIFYSDALANALKHLSSPPWFDGYFRLAIQPSQIAASEFKTILSLLSKPKAFDHMLARLNQDNAIIKFLSQLDDPYILKKISKKHARTLIAALLDNGDLFPVGIAGPLNLDSPARIHRIINVLLTEYSSQEERFIVLQEAINDAKKSIYLLVYELDTLSLEHNQENEYFKPIEFRQLSGKRLQTLGELIAIRIEEWAENDSLNEYPFLIPVLTGWLTYGHPEHCKHYVKKLTDTDKGLVFFLVSILKEAIATVRNEYIYDPAWVIYLDEIKTFIHPDDLVIHTKLIFEDPYFDKLREAEQIALMIFLDLMKVETNKIMP